MVKLNKSLTVAATAAALVAVGSQMSDFDYLKYVLSDNSDSTGSASTQAAAPTPTYTPMPIPGPDDWKVDLGHEFDQLNDSLRQLQEDMEKLKNLGNNKPTLNDPIAAFIGIDNPIVHYTDFTSMTCNPWVVGDHNAFYCNADDTIYISSWADSQSYAVKVFIYAHEDGHSEDPNYLTSSTLDKEQYADTYGGRTVCRLVSSGKLPSSAIDEARNFLLGLGSDDHGTGPQRVAAFDRGCGRA